MAEYRINGGGLAFLDAVGLKDMLHVREVETGAALSAPKKVRVCF
jgi:hypothetical protein